MYLQQFFTQDELPSGCSRCHGDDMLDFEIRMAFQPIVDASTRSVFAYEALVRGANGEGAGAVIGRVRSPQMYRFDQTCRVKAIETAARLGMECYLSINFIPNAVYEPAACIRMTLAAAEKTGFDSRRLIFEMTEGEKIDRPEHVLSIVRDYQKRGFLVAIDDFGAGYSGLNLLADVQPNIVKLDMALTRNIHIDKVRHAITDGVARTCGALGYRVVAEGVEQVEEYRALRALGVDLFQGYLFAKPGLESLPTVPEAVWNALDS